jgi:hypothetical protein
MNQVYTEEFFQQHAPGSLASARVMLPILFRYYQPKSVVDVGCGLGPWLRAVTELGANDILGIDGEYVDRQALFIPETNFLSADLRQRISVNRRFDLAMSLEVAEHLPYERSATFVEDLVALSDVVLFSAALPYQGGTDHINEQWLEFWAILFQRHGYVPYDFLRRECSGDPAVEFWYSQNTIVFCKKERVRDAFPCESLAAGLPLSQPHPLTFLVNICRYRPLAAGMFELEWEDYRSLVLQYQKAAGELPPLQVLDPTAAGESSFRAPRMFLADARAARARQEQELAHGNAEIGRLETELARVNAEMALKNKQFAQKAAEIELFVKHVEGLRREVRSLRASLSWRLTAPMRRCAAWLLGHGTELKKSS